MLFPQHLAGDLFLRMQAPPSSHMRDDELAPQHASQTRAREGRIRPLSRRPHQADKNHPRFPLPDEGPWGYSSEVQKQIPSIHLSILAAAVLLPAAGCRPTFDSTGSRLPRSSYILPLPHYIGDLGPLQSLAAHAIAESPDDDGRLDTVSDVLLGRELDEAERTLLRGHRDEASSRFRSNPEDARSMAGPYASGSPADIAELATWVVIARHVGSLDR